MDAARHPSGTWRSACPLIKPAVTTSACNHHVAAVFWHVCCSRQLCAQQTLPSYSCTCCVGHRAAVTTLCMLQVLACVNILLGLVDYLPMGHGSSPCTSSTSSQSAHYNPDWQSSPFSVASRHADGHSQDSIESPLQFQSTQRMAASPLPAYCPLLETATSLSSVNTTT